jgi:transglutaminase-like putative cysteine protease
VTSVEWEQLYRPSEADRFERPLGLLGALRDGGRWLNLLLLFIALMAMTTSLENANWVDEMPSLTTATLVGLGTGWVLAQIPLRAWLLQILGIAIGLAGVFALVMAKMELADPLLGTGARQRWTELWLRLRDWGTALVEGGVSNDPLPFVLMLIFSVWAVSYVAAWAVVRWRNVWAALIPPGFVLLTNISYLPDESNLQLVVFLFASVLLVLQLHFARALDRWRRERISWPDMMSIEVAFAGVWIALALIVAAWVVPTANNWGPVADAWQRAVAPVSDRLEGLSRVFIGVSANRDIPIHNFGEVLPLQGTVKLNDEPLMEVVTDELGNLRGAVYDEYTGAGWRVSSALTRPQIGTTVDAAEFGTPLTQAQLRQPIAVEITVIGPVPDRRLLALGDPIATDVDSDLILGAGELDIIGIAPKERLKEGATYSSVGAISGASIETMLSTGRDYPTSIRERYTQLPDDLPPEIEVLTRSLVADGTHPYQAARIIEEHLRSGYPYTLEIPDPPPLRDAVDYFLFEAEAGYFDHHASAMAIMLRTIGIPTRIAAGFAVDEDDLDATTKTYILTEEDAWAWPEVYFPGLGWVEFNPTPGRPLVARAGDDSERRLLILPDGSDALQLTDDELLQELELLLGTQGDTTVLTNLDVDSGSGVGTVVVRVLTLLVAGAAVLLLVVLGVRFGWEYAFRQVPVPLRQWAKLQRLTTWAGIRPAPMHTPLEWAGLATATVGDDDGDLERLARGYTSVRYGDPAHEQSEDEIERLTASYRRVRKKLWRRIVMRPVPRRRRALAVSGSAGGGTSGIEGL